MEIIPTWKRQLMNVPAARDYTTAVYTLYRYLISYILYRYLIGICIIERKLV